MAATAALIVAAAGSAYAANQQAKGQKKAAGAGDQDRAIKQVLARWYTDQMGATGGRTQSLCDAKTNGVWDKPELQFNEFEQRKLGLSPWGKDKKFFSPGADGKLQQIRYFTPQDLSQMRAPYTVEGASLGAKPPVLIKNKDTSGFFGKILNLASDHDILGGLPNAHPSQAGYQNDWTQLAQQRAAYQQRLQQQGFNPNGPQWAAPGYGGVR